MNLFITGATGFLGRYVVEAAVQAGHRCICPYRSVVPDELLGLNGVKFVQGSLSDNWDIYFSDVDALVHLAAIGVSPRTASRKEYFQVNLIDSLALVETAVNSGVSTVVACGSCFEYGAAGERYEYIPVDAPLEPLNAYGSSKAAASVSLCSLARELKFNLTLLRPFHFYGEGQAFNNLWPSLKRAATSGQDFEITMGEQVRDYMPVEAVAKKFLEALAQELEEYRDPVIKNIGSGEPQTLKSFCEYWWKHWSATGKLHVGSIPYRDNEVMRYVPEV